jgi:type IV pilus assembly protein PilC
MKVYKYVGKNIEGNIIKGLYKANSSLELILFLKERNYFLLKYNEKIVRKRLTLFKGKLTYESISFFSNQLKVVIGAGITILQALNIINLQCKNQLLKENINIIVTEINHGESLNKSLEKMPHKFPSFFCSMVKVGEESGKLDSALSQISDYYYKEFKLKKKIRSAMAYPIFVSVAIFIFSIFSLVKFIPSFESIFATLNSEIPYTTQVILNLSSFARNNGLLILFIIIFIAIITKICLNHFKEYFRNFNIIMKVPLIGRVYKEDLEMKLSKILFMLISSGINVMRALEIAADTINDNITRKKLIEVISSIRNGYSLSEAMDKTVFFSEVIISFIKIGEEAGKLELMLQKLSIIYEENLDNDINKLTEIINPFMMLVLGGVVGILILSLILPMFTMLNTL